MYSGYSQTIKNKLDHTTHKFKNLDLYRNIFAYVLGKVLLKTKTRCEETKTNRTYTIMKT